MSRCSFLGIALCLLGAACGGDDDVLDGPDTSFYELDGGPDSGRSNAGRGGGTAGRQSGTGGTNQIVAGTGAGGTSVNTGGTGTAGTGEPVPVAGVSGSGTAGVAGMNGRPPIFCDANGYCLYPGGLLCYPDGPCCYPDQMTGQCCTANGCRPVPPWIMQPGNEPTPMDRPWVPPLPEDDVGDPGWRDSDKPLCSRQSNFAPYMQSIWSDSRGVFVASQTQTEYDPNNPNGCVGCPRDAVFFNDGSGWEEMEGVAFEGESFSRPGEGPLFITGFDNGPLVLYGFAVYDEKGYPCGLSMFEDGVRTCQPVDGVYDVHVVNDTLAYGLLQGRLIRFDGTSWGPLPVTGQFPEMMALWADDTTVMATTGGPGTIYTLKNGMFSVEDTRTLENFSAIWGFSPTDVWSGTYQGSLYHYNGTTWSTVEWAKATADNGCGPEGDWIQGMWGVNGILYFITPTTLQRWNGTSVEKITELESGCNQFMGPQVFTSIWGASENEVYIGLMDHSQPNNQCGTSFMLYYDGDKFHQM